VNYNTLYSLSESVGKCFGDNVVRAIHIGIDKAALGCTEQATVDSSPCVHRSFLRKLTIQETALRGIAFLLRYHGDARQVRFVRQHVYQRSMGD
jgi:hypothetical protein